VWVRLRLRLRLWLRLRFWVWLRLRFWVWLRLRLRLRFCARANILEAIFQAHTNFQAQS
jgi:hypothetical protein